MVPIHSATARSHKARVPAGLCKNHQQNKSQREIGGVW